MLSAQGLLLLPAWVVRVKAMHAVPSHSLLHGNDSVFVLSAAEYNDEILSHIEPFVYEWTAGKQGSISAEHGLGQMKAECIG